MVQQNSPFSQNQKNIPSSPGQFGTVFGGSPQTQNQRGKSGNKMMVKSDQDEVREITYHLRMQTSSPKEKICCILLFTFVKCQNL